MINIWFIYEIWSLTKLLSGFVKKIAFIQTGLTGSTGFSHPFFVEESIILELKSYPVDPVNPVKWRGLCSYYWSLKIKIFIDILNDPSLELIKSLLESTGLKVLEQNCSPKGSIWEGDSSIWRSNINKPAKVLVPIPDYLKAMEVVYDWRSSQAVIQFGATGL